ncbi:RNA polymerase sigma factor [Actinoplanes xinjiangensis]|uniref:RNA polymerase sigma factor n=1 Tax=Actinoplanes xinjiangensis TaxID=512350 RepID=UPI00342E4D97
MTTSTDPDAEAVFTTLMTEHGPAVLGYLTRRTDPTQDAADLMAEVFVVAWRRLDDVPSDPAQARAWLLGTARGTLANHRRSATRRSHLADRLRQHLHIQPDSTPHDAGSVVRSALEQLSTDDRELLTLIAWEDLSPAQAATILRLSPAATRKRLERARTRLRALLEADEPALSSRPATSPRSYRPAPDPAL